MTRRALITGISGQDGAYLARFLLHKGYQVIGARRRSASGGLWRLEELGILNQVEMYPIDLLEFSNIMCVLEKVRPHEIYNLAAQSFVGTSFDQPLYTADVGAMGVTRMLEAVRMIDPAIRLYQASTSEMFGMAREMPQSERTPFYPRSPYAVAKLYAHWMVVNYRESYGLHACSGILFNHESPLRGEEFVTRKITQGLARVRHGLSDVIELGNLDAARDWGFAGDYVEAMWAMVQRERADDFVIATGRTATIREFVKLAGAAAGFDIEWRGEGEAATGIDRNTGRTVVRVNPAFYRPTEVDILLGNATKARETLGWAPKMRLEELAHMMMAADMERVERRVAARADADTGSSHKARMGVAL